MAYWYPSYQKQFQSVVLVKVYSLFAQGTFVSGYVFVCPLVYLKCNPCYHIMFLFHFVSLNLSLICDY